jgi:hypothetical protein
MFVLREHTGKVLPITDVEGEKRVGKKKGENT